MIVRQSVAAATTVLAILAGGLPGVSSEDRGKVVTGRESETHGHFGDGEVARLEEEWRHVPSEECS